MAFKTTTREYFYSAHEDSLFVAGCSGGAQQGTGFLIDGYRGLLLTAQHVVEACDKVVVYPFSNTCAEFPASLVAKDNDLDIALVQLTDSAGQAHFRKRPALELALDQEPSPIEVWIAGFGQAKANDQSPPVFGSSCAKDTRRALEVAPQTAQYQDSSDEPFGSITTSLPAGNSAAL